MSISFNKLPRQGHQEELCQDDILSLQKETQVRMVIKWVKKKKVSPLAAATVSWLGFFRVFFSSWCNDWSAVLVCLCFIFVEYGILWCNIRVSVQGVKSLGSHFACLCRRFEFYEVKKKFLLLFFKKKMEILLHF